MGDLAGTLESFLAGKQEQSVLVRTLNNSPYSPENVVDLAYYLLLAGNALGEKEALGQADTYFKTRKNQHELVALLDAYAQDSRALSVSGSTDELAQRVAKLQEEHSKLKEEFALLDKEHEAFDKAATARLYAADSKPSRKAFNQFLKQRRLSEKQFDEQYAQLLNKRGQKAKSINALAAELKYLRRALELYDKRHEIDKERQQRREFLNKEKLSKLYESMLPLTTKAPQSMVSYTPAPQPTTPASDPNVAKALDVMKDISKHAITEMADTIRRFNPKVVVDVPQQGRQGPSSTPSLPPARKRRTDFSDPEVAKQLNKLLRKKTGTEFGYWEDLFKRDPKVAREKFIQKYGDDEVFYE